MGIRSEINKFLKPVFQVLEPDAAVSSQQESHTHTTTGGDIRSMIEIGAYLKEKRFNVYEFAKMVGIKETAVSVLKKFVSVIFDAGDAETFMNFWEEYNFLNSSIFDAVCDLHEHKLLHISISLSDFSCLYNRDKQFALSCLFQHAVSYNDVKELKKYNVASDEIYALHVEDRFVPLYKLVPKLTIFREHFEKMAH